MGAAAWLVGLTAAGCSRSVETGERPEGSGAATALAGGGARAPSVTEGNDRGSPTAPSVERSAMLPASSASGMPAARASDAQGPPTAVSLGQVVDLGPARLVAVGAGVVATLDAASDLRVMPLAAVAPPTGEEPKAEAVAPTAPVLVGPSPTYAYWVAAGQLRRRHIRDGQALGEAEALTEDASAGLGIAAVRAGGARPVDVVAYVGLPQGDQGERPARLWVQGQGPIALSRESGNATAVGLVARDERKLLAFSLDGRLGMSLLHAVSVELDDGGRARVGDDRVVYVAGSAERNTRFDVMTVAGRALVLLPIANESAGFGLASLLVPDRGEAVALWRHYPNGLDPAPVVGAELCGVPHVAYARPAEARSDAGHVVELAAIGGDGALGPPLPVGRAGRIVQVVMAGASEAKPLAGPPRAAASSAGAAGAGARESKPSEVGGWIAYAADTGLWAHPIRCGAGAAR